MIRMGLVHVILIHGTNNTTTDELDRTQLIHRVTGSKLVLAARIFYAAFIWIAKLTVLEFLKRTIGASWAKSYELGLRLIYGFLAVTFIGVIIGTLAECHPFSHYWQVVPDPGPQCRQGLVQLLVMGVCDIITDVVLIAFPIPVVLRSKMPLHKKLSLISLFLVSGVLIGITGYRIPSTINRHADQPYRSLIASLEILAAAFVANVVIIGSFIRDKGVKKAKFNPTTSAASDSQGGISRTRTKSVTFRYWGSDEDLVSGMGMALPPMLRVGTGTSAPRPAAAAPPGETDMDIESIGEEKAVRPTPQEKRRKSSQKLEKAFGFTKKDRKRRDSNSSVSSTDTDIKLKEEPKPLANQMSFFDVGGLVDQPNGGNTPTPCGNSRDPSMRDVPAPQHRGRSGSKAFLNDIGGFLARHKEEERQVPSPYHQSPRGSKSQLGVGAATSRSLTPVQQAQSHERRRFSRSPRPSRMLESMSQSQSRNNSKDPRRKSELRHQATAPTSSPRIGPSDDGPDSLSFGDAGGLLR